MSIGIEARKIPLMPPMTNIEMNPSVNSIDVVKRRCPPQRVASHEKILTPVGTAMIMDVIINGMRSSGFMPLENMWCAQTRKPKIAIAMLEKAIILYPNIGLREKTGTVSEMMPKPGKIMMYTAGCE